MVKCLRNILRRLLDLFFPKYCVGCKRLGQYLCLACRPGPADANRCIKCDEPLAEIWLHQQCFAGGPLAGVLSVAEHGGAVAAAVHQLKYRFVADLADELGALMATAAVALPPEVSVIMPVPLNPRREAWRGFNQAEVLAHALGRHIELPVNQTLKRVRDTPPQVGKDRQQRAENMAGAFRVTGAVPETGIVLVDDVVTTGATLNACANALLAAGAGPVWGLAVTRARGRQMPRG